MSTVISDPESFWLAAQQQRVCAVCGRANGRPDGRGRTWHPHHVVPRQILKRLHRPEWDTRNALRVCTDCHMAFEWAGPGKVDIDPAKWTQENVCYVYEVLALTAVQLEGKYGELDVRFWLHADGKCPACQLT